MRVPAAVLAATLVAGGCGTALGPDPGLEGLAVTKVAPATIIPGSKFFARADAGHPTNFLRLAYSHATPDEIDEGIRRLAAAYSSTTRTAPVTAAT